MKGNMINWKTTPTESATIADIAARAVKLARFHGIRISYREILMDVTATHCNGCKLDLDGLLNTDNGNFGHDVFGIRKYIDRNTGKLTDFFVPRYAMREHLAA